MRAIASCRSWRFFSLSACSWLRVASVSVEARNSSVGEEASHQKGCVAPARPCRARALPKSWPVVGDHQPIAIARYMISGSALSALSLREGALPG
jgi:hypothetical protein